MNELEFARFIKSGLGAPSPSPRLASRVAVEINQRGAGRSAGRHVVAYRVGGAALALGLIAALNLAGAYYLPWYGTALANAPVVGPLFAHPPHPPFAHPEHTPAPSHH